MSTKQPEPSLEEWIDALFMLCNNAKGAFFYSNYLDNPYTNEERYITQSRHFSYISHSMFRILIIELAKIVNSQRSNEPRSLYKLFWFLQNQSLSEEKLLQIKRISSELRKYNQTVRTILLLRNRLYAHDDRKAIDLSEVDISYPMLKDLIDFLFSAIREIASITLDIDYVYGPHYDEKEREEWDDFRILVEAKKKRRMI